MHKNGFTLHQSLHNLEKDPCCKHPLYIDHWILSVWGVMGKQRGTISKQIACESSLLRRRGIKPPSHVGTYFGILWIFSFFTFIHKANWYWVFLKASYWDRIRFFWYQGRYQLKVKEMSRQKIVYRGMDGLVSIDFFSAKWWFHSRLLWFRILESWSLGSWIWKYNC